MHIIKRINHDGVHVVVHKDTGGIATFSFIIGNPTAGGMKDADKDGREVSVLIDFTEESEDDTAYSLKKAVKERVVNTVFIIAGGTKLRMAAERDKLVFFKNLLEDVHKTIKKECKTEGYLPSPQD